MKTTKTAGIIVGLIILTSFQLYAQDKSGKSVIIGRFIIKSQKPITNDKVRIHFNERLWGKYASKTDDSGYFEIKVPQGKNYLALVEYFRRGSFYRNIPENYATIDLKDANKIYYVGDIELAWDISEKDSRQMGGAIGVMREARKAAGKVVMSVNTSAVTLQHFQSKYTMVDTELMKID